MILPNIQSSFNQQGFMQHIGAELLACADGFCEIKLPFKPELAQQNGFFHAGSIATIADNAAGYAANSLMPESSNILSVEFKVNLLSPGRGEAIIARGKVVKNGRTLTVCTAEVFTLNGEEEKLCALAQVTLIELKTTKP